MKKRTAVISLAALLAVQSVFPGSFSYAEEAETLTQEESGIEPLGQEEAAAGFSAGDEESAVGFSVPEAAMPEGAGKDTEEMGLFEEREDLTGTETIQPQQEGPASEVPEIIPETGMTGEGSDDSLQESETGMSGEEMENSPGKPEETGTDFLSQDEYALDEGFSEEGAVRIEEIETVGEDAVPVDAEVSSGTLESGILWSVSGDVLTISGKGETGSPEEYPWWDFKDSIVEIDVQSGVTGLGEAAFYGFSNLERVSLPKTLKTLDTAVFAECGMLDEISLNEGLVRIGKYVFQRSGVESISLPASVSELDDLAFYLAGSLQTIEVSAQNSTYASADGMLFSKDFSKLLKCPEGRSQDSYQIPGTVKELGNYAFARTDISDIMIPSGVQILGEGVFYGSGVETLTIPDSVGQVGDFLCQECYALKSVKIGNGLKALSYRTFSDCTELSEVDLGSSLEDMDYLAFAECHSLKSVRIPEKVTFIKNGTFGNCTGLEHVEFPAGLQEIWHQAFLNCEALTSVSFPAGLKSINRYAFYGTGIKTVTIPASVKEVGDHCFPDDAVLVFERELEKQGDGSYLDTLKISMNVTFNYKEAFRVLKIVNQERAKEDLSALKMDKSLLKTAMLRASELGIYYSHTRPTGGDCFSANSKMTAENIAAGYLSASAVMTGWMKSPGHRANILGSHTCIGIGAVVINGTMYWAQCFGDDTYDAVTADSYTDKTKTTSLNYIIDSESEFKIMARNESVTVEAGKKNSESPRVQIGFNNTYTFTEIDPSWLDFRSSDNAICKVDSQGYLTGVSKGTAKIYVSMKNGDTSALTVSVKVVSSDGDNPSDKKPPQVLELTADSLTMKTGQSTTKLKVTKMTEGDSLKSVKSSNPAIVKVSNVKPDGTFKLSALKKIGTVYLTVTLESGKSRTIEIQVQEEAVRTTKITGLSKKLTIQKGTSKTLKPEITPVTSQDKISYKSSKSKIASVSSKGVIQARKPGKAKITVKSGKKKFVITVTVTK